VGTAEIVLAVADLAADGKWLEAEIAEACDDGRCVEGGMNRVAGARVVEREVEQRLGRQAGAAAAEPDAGRREVPQIPKRPGRRRRRCHLSITRQGRRPRAA